jgi:hypothetical protein
MFRNPSVTSSETGESSTLTNDLSQIDMAGLTASQAPAPFTQELPLGTTVTSGTAAFGTDTVTHGGSGLVFVNTYGAGVTSALHSAIIAAETYLESHFTNSVTLNVSFDLQALNPAFSAQDSFAWVNVTYSQLVNALQAHATSPDDTAAVNALNLMADPSGGAMFTVPNGQAKLLGLPGTTNGIDETIQLNSSVWTDANITANPGDAIAVLIHELSRGAMGRLGGLWGPMDLFRYTTSGQLDNTGGQDGQLTYFSPNGQNINAGLQFHNPINAQGQDDGFDWADWDQVGDNVSATDPFGPGGPGAGDPGILSKTDLQVMDVLGWQRSSPPVGDLNGNAVTDLLWRNSTTGQVATWLMNNGNVGATNVLGSVSSAWQLVGSGDINGDLTADLVWRNSSTGAVESWLINGGHTVGGSGVGSASSAWQVVGIGDINHDGNADLIWRNPATGAVESWLLNNGHISGGGGIGGASSVWQSCGLGDFNGDGTTDALWKNTTTGEVDTWLIQNGKLVGGTAVGAVSSAWQSIGVGDLNNDGTDDILWQNTSTGEVDSWLMQNGHVTGGAVLGTMASGWQAASVGDFDGAGTADILWHNATTGASTVWQISNDKVVGTHSVSTLATIWQALPLTSAG